MIKLNVNGKDYEVDVRPDTPLLWVIRDNLGLTGTKFGCGIAQCGACTIHLNGAALRSCVTPVAAGAGKKLLPSKGWKVTWQTGFKKPGQKKMCRNAVIVKAGRLWLQLFY